MIACLYCGVRNFTAFSDSAEPEEIMDVLQNVHKTMGRLVARHGGTVGYDLKGLEKRVETYRVVGLGSNA